MPLQKIIKQHIVSIRNCSRRRRGGGTLNGKERGQMDEKIKKLVEIAQTLPELYVEALTAAAVTFSTLEERSYEPEGGEADDGQTDHPGA